jgi:hypothetical protein
MVTQACLLLLLTLLLQLLQHGTEGSLVLLLLLQMCQLQLAAERVCGRLPGTHRPQEALLLPAAQRCEMTSQPICLAAPAAAV